MRRDVAVLSLAAIAAASVASVVSAMRSLSPGLFLAPIVLVVANSVAVSGSLTRTASLFVFGTATGLLLIFIAVASATVGVYFVPALVLSVAAWTRRLKSDGS